MPPAGFRSVAVSSSVRRRLVAFVAVSSSFARFSFTYLKNVVKGSRQWAASNGERAAGPATKPTRTQKRKTSVRDKILQNWRRQLFKIRFFDPMWRRKLSEMIDFITAIDSVKFSSKSELSSQFFGRLKITSASALGGMYG